jgi:hypothetical protein
MLWVGILEEEMVRGGGRFGRLAGWRALNIKMGACHLQCILKCNCMLG